MDIWHFKRVLLCDRSQRKENGWQTERGVDGVCLILVLGDVTIWLPQRRQRLDVCCDSRGPRSQRLVCRNLEHSVQVLYSLQPPVLFINPSAVPLYPLPFSSPASFASFCSSLPRAIQTQPTVHLCMKNAFMLLLYWWWAVCLVFCWRIQKCDTD